MGYLMCLYLNARVMCLLVRRTIHRERQQEQHDALLKVVVDTHSQLLVLTRAVREQPAASSVVPSADMEPLDKETNTTREDMAASLDLGGLRALVDSTVRIHRQMVTSMLRKVEDPVSRHMYPAPNSPLWNLQHSSRDIVCLLYIAANVPGTIAPGRGAPSSREAGHVGGTVGPSGRGQCPHRPTTEALSELVAPSALPRSITAGQLAPSGYQQTNTLLSQTDAFYLIDLENNYIQSTSHRLEFRHVVAPLGDGRSLSAEMYTSVALV